MSYFNYLTLGFATTAGLTAAVAGIRQLAYAQKTIKTGDTISNTTAKTAFASQLLFPANTAQVGAVYRVKGYGTYSTPALNVGTTTCGLQLVNQTNSYVAPMASSPAITNALSAASLPFSFEVDMIVQSIGTFGSIRSCGSLTFNTALGTASAITLAPVSSSVDTTQPQWMQVWTQFSIAANTISSTLQLFYVESIQPVSTST